MSTGGRTELGKIGKALQQIKPEATSLQKETGRLVRTLAIVGLAACCVVVVAYALTRGGTAQVWKEGLLAGIAMAMAILPEEFPVVLTIFLALGAWRISRSRVLTRRMPAIETLGAATVLCVDKTGTLTRNQMTLKKLAIDGRTAVLGPDVANLSEEFHALLENAILASKRDPFDPMEQALQAAGERLLMQTEHLHPEWTLLREYPLTPQLLAVSQAWKLGAGEDVAVASKGAPEAIAELCRLSPDKRAAVAVCGRWSGGGRAPGARRSPGPVDGGQPARSSTASSHLSSWDWWASRIRSALLCRPRSPSAVRRASAS